VATRAAVTHRGTGAKRQEAQSSAPTKAGSRPAVVPQGTAASGQPGFDRLIYERVRLGIMSALATNDHLTFNELKSLFNASDGNLGAHARKLEEAGYVACTKSFEARRPKSIYRITAAGRKALLRYLEHIEAVIKATRRV
jgi:DNA-binding transcriptional ArsR family regulator